VSLKLLVSVAALVAAAAAATAAAAAEADAATLFTQNCAACHQAQGEGIPGAFPALAGNPVVQGDPKGVAWVLTHGRGGMPNFAEEMSDAEIAKVLTYVRSSWGNKASPLDAGTVASVRGAAAPPNTGAGLPYH
jgi:mono/diheme cytochrome c family protein